MAEARRRSRAVDDDIRPAMVRAIFEQASRNPERSQDRELRAMLADHEDAVGDLREHLRAQISKAAVAEHDDPIVAIQPQLGRDLEGRGHGLDEHRGIGRNGIGDRVKVALRNRDDVGKRAVVIENPDNTPAGAVAGAPCQADVACAAAAVDLPDDAPAGQRPR